VYESYRQRPISSFALMVRTSSDPESLAPELHKAVSRVDAELPLARVLSMSTILARQRGGTDFFLRMLGAFALLAIILAAIGIYGLISYSVGQRSHELAIRMALGASGREVRRTILNEGLRMSSMGALIGILASLPLPRIFLALLNGLHTNNPWIYTIVSLAMIMTCLLATYVPARRASRIDPMMALHSE
jgi:putative ABC transport system permease protein